MSIKRSSNFSTIVFALLIISTVIVFAVLVFISYENSINRDLEATQIDTINECDSLATSVSKIINGDKEFVYSDDRFKKEVIEDFFDSLTQYKGGVAILTNPNKGVLYVSGEDKHMAIDYSNIVMDEQTINIQRANDNLFYIIATNSVEDSNLFVVYISDFSKTEQFYEFSEVFITPVLIALGLSICFIILVVKFILAPVRAVSRVVAKVAEGDYSVRVDGKFSDDSMTYLNLSSDTVVMVDTINDMISKIENQEKEREIFISSIAHDIRTPITSANGFITAMSDGTIEPERFDDYFPRIKSELRTINEMVTSITEATSLSKTNPELMESFDLRSMITDIANNLVPQLRAKDINLILRLDDRSKANRCYGEPQQLCRVIVNIITNAIKFTPDHGTIIVTTKARLSDKDVYITVEDSGPGVSEDIRTRVFESFFKKDAARTGEGFGLGLYICKQILLGHGMTIVLEESSELGGAMFCFAFPMPPEDK